MIPGAVRSTIRIQKTIQAAIVLKGACRAENLKRRVVGHHYPDSNRGDDEHIQNRLSHRGR
jgi:hypothetical protein